MHMRRHWRRDPYWFAVLGDRHDHFARVQVQNRSADARRLAVDCVTYDRPAHGGAVHAQLMGAPGQRLEC
jgi:hypothetical protein